jgi:C1A family cysteine protease
MKNLIRHILKEETNKSLKLFTNLYDIEDNGSVYRGENKFQTYVTFYPKDYDNEMTREAATSICNWKINEDNEPVFMFMNLPNSQYIPLMDYIGETEDLEEYLEVIHGKEAERFIKRINHRRTNPLR